MTQELSAPPASRTSTAGAWVLCAAVMILMAFLFPKASWVFILLAIAACSIGWRWVRMRVILQEDQLILRNLFVTRVVPREQVTGVRDGQFLNWKSGDQQHESLIGYLMGLMDTGSPNMEGRAKQIATDAIEKWCTSKS